MNVLSPIIAQGKWYIEPTDWHYDKLVHINNNLLENETNCIKGNIGVKEEEYEVYYTQQNVTKSNALWDEKRKDRCIVGYILPFFVIPQILDILLFVIFFFFFFFRWVK